MGLVTRIRNLGRREAVDAEIAEELRAHLSLAVEEMVRNGMSEDEARRVARLKFGNPVDARERTMSADAALGIDGAWRDVQFALRQLRKSLGFAATAMVTLALGIGANIVVFGVLNAVLLQPLHVKDPQQLVQVFHKEWMTGGPSYPAFEDYRQRNSVFSGMAAAYGMSSMGLEWKNAVHKVNGYDVTGNYFDLLGVKPELGRFFGEADEHGPGSAPYVVISDALWRREFHADAGVIGTRVELNRNPFTIVGVAPRDFQGTERLLWPDYWVPIVDGEQLEGWDFLHNRIYTPIAVIARLKRGVTIAQASDNLNAISRDLAREYPATDKDDSARLARPGLEGDRSDAIEKFLYGVTLLAFLVLVAACANLASLFAARTADRSRELALRVALGSSRLRLLRQMLTESVLLSMMGGAAGVACAGLLLRFLNRWQPFGDGSEQLLVTPDARAILVGLGLSIASGLLFGAIPARHVWQSRPLQAMKSGPVDSAHLRRFAVRDLLLGAQIAICTLLVTASLVAVRGMMRELAAPLGIKPQGAMVAEVDLGMVGVGGDAALAAQKRMIEAVESLPGVTAAGTTNFLPLSGAGMTGIPIYLQGTVDFSLQNQTLGSRVYPVSPDYLKAAGTRLLAGRNVTWHDDAHTPRVAIVNESFARGMFGNLPAVGRHFLMWGDLYEVIGVAEDGKYYDLNEDPTPAIYTSTAQNEQSSVQLVVRSQAPPREMASALQRTLTAIVPTAPIRIHTWEDALSNVLFPARAATAALGVMGLLAAMLAVTGIFGMAAYSVSRRMKELGIRVALGAKRAQVLAAAVGRPVSLLAIGSAAGLLAGFFASGLLGRLVYQADPRDPIVIGGAIATMAALGALATLIPARRALSVDAVRLMREE
jgi:predicted permease